MIAIILLFLSAGIQLGLLIDSIANGDEKATASHIILFVLFLLCGIFCYTHFTHEFSAAKYEISSKVTTRKVDTYEGRYHFTHMEKDTIYIVSRK